MDCRLGEPGYEAYEDIVSVSKSALRGGYTSLAASPATDPVTDNKTVVRYVLSTAREKSAVNVFVCGGMTKGLEGKEIAEIGSMVSAGVVAVADGHHSVEDARLMRNILTYCKMFSVPVLTFCEDRSLVGDGSVNEGIISIELGVRGIPYTAESVYVARNIVLAGEAGVCLCLLSISAKTSVDIIRAAKSLGGNVFSCTCPHYFTLTEEAVIGYNTFAKVSPPLKTGSDAQAILEGLVDGTIDVIATGHSPVSIDHKISEFDRAKNGISSLETAFLLSYDALVKTKALTETALAGKMAKNPAQILRLSRKGEIAEGMDADLFLFDKTQTTEVAAALFASKAKFSPYEGAKLDGKITLTMVGGEVEYRSG
jgi:dihydroorotase